MKVKTLVKTGVGVSAAILGAGAAIYECALNTKINQFFINLFDNPSEEQDALYKGGLYDDCQQWYNENKGEDQTITTDELGRIHAYFFWQPEPTHKWAIMCHGYNSSPISTAVYVKHFYEKGYNCISPSMRGWGNDETKYCTMGYHDKDLLRAWIDHVLALDPEAELILHGYSMGAVTIMLATGEGMPSNVKAAICDCGFARCVDQFNTVVKNYAKIPGFPLVNAANLVSIARGNFDFRKNNPVESVARSTTPTIFLHGTADDFIPCSNMDLLYDACSAEPKAKQAIEGGYHACAVLKDPDLYWKAVDGFLDKVLAEKK